MKRIDQAVANILRVKFQLGLFDNPYPDKSLTKGFASEESRKVSLQAAHEAITLLKNEGAVLPLAKDKKVLVTGPCANKLSVLNGGWTITWQGDDEKLYPQEKMTILEAIENKVGKDKVSYVEAVSFDKELDIPQAVAAARESDLVIACIGEPSYCETPGNIDDLTMSLPQLNLIEALAKAGKPLVLVLAQGRPRVIRAIVDDAQAIVMAYLPGMEGGPAVADILFGDVNPSGKLPFTYPKYPSAYTCYDHKKSEETAPNKFDPQWQFGHGLSYTSFAYRKLRLDKNELSQKDSLTVTVEVANTGSRPGKEIVHLYLSDLVASITPPVKVLKRFTKVELQPGQSETVKFVLGRDDLAFIGPDNKPIVEPGQFKATVGGLSQTFVLR